MPNINQIYELVNLTTKELLGEEYIVAEDLSNIVDIGKDIGNLEDGMQTFKSKLIDRIGMTQFVDRVYTGYAPKIKKTSFEYGSILQKIFTRLPDATVNEDWELENGTSYDPFVYNGAEGVTKLWNKYVTFEIDRSIQDYQLKSAFKDALAMGGFISMIWNEIDKSFTAKMDELIMRLINNCVLDTVQSELATGETLATHTGAKAVNLLKLFKDKYQPEYTITADNCIYNEDFLRFANNIIRLRSSQMTALSTQFNMGGEARFTPTANQHLVLLSQFASAFNTYLYSGTYNEEYVKLPSCETVPHWQGIKTNSTSLDIGATGTIIGKTETNTGEFTMTGVVGVLFDNDTIGVYNDRRTINSQYNPKASFTNYFVKEKVGYFADYNENFVVFYVA